MRAADLPQHERELICIEQLHIWLSEGKDARNVWEIVRRRRWHFSRRCTAADAFNAMIDAHANRRPRFALVPVEDAA
jgi:hypothetical protein